MSTPEAKVKKMVRDVLNDFRKIVECSGYHVDNLYQFWPVPSGFGASSLDVIVTYYGRAIYIETKAPGKKPTPRQELTIAETKAAGAIVLVIDSEQGCHELRVILQKIKDDQCKR